MSGALVSPPRLRNPGIPKAISDIVMKAMAPETGARYQRASDLLDDVLAARHSHLRPSRFGGQAGGAPQPGSGQRTPAAAVGAGRDDAQRILSRLRPRQAPA